MGDDEFMPWPPDQDEPDQPDRRPSRKKPDPHAISDALRERLSAGRDPRLDEWLRDG
jgi:hypothetical protein